MDKSGFYKGKHYTMYVNDVKYLIKDNKLDDAEKLLIKLVNSTENESKCNNYGVAPWYYERLAIIYKKKNDIKSETDILERFATQKHAPGVKPPKLLARLEKLKTRTLLK
jgi:hypothetical protein